MCELLGLGVYIYLSTNGKDNFDAFCEKKIEFSCQGFEFWLNPVLFSRVGSGESIIVSIFGTDWKVLLEEVEHGKDKCSGSTSVQ